MKLLPNLLLFITFISFSQSGNPIDAMQYGATLKVKIGLNPNSRNEPCINYKISSSLGIASKWLNEGFYPSLNTELLFYNSGLGSRTDTIMRYSTLDAIFAFTLTAGKIDDSFKNNIAIIDRNIPLRYFADFAIPALQNPYKCSASIGSNIIITTDSGRSLQRVGFVNLNTNGIQLSYYNDGTPFQYFFAGDGKDRYYTGGGVLSYNNSLGALNQLKSYSFEISYHKFTGFNEGSFELSNSISASNVDYKSKYQKYYNKSLWRINLQSNNYNQGFSLGCGFYNSIRFDGQHLIHWIQSNSFHIVPYGAYYDFDTSCFMNNNKFKN